MGPGGTGKTRLSLQVAQGLLDQVKAEARELVTLDRARESDFHEVSALPGARGFLFTYQQQTEAIYR